MNAALPANKVPPRQVMKGVSNAEVHNILLQKSVVFVDLVDGVDHGLQPLNAAIVDLVAARLVGVLGFFVHGEESTCRWE